MVVQAAGGLASISIQAIAGCNTIDRTLESGGRSAAQVPANQVLANIACASPFALQIRNPMPTVNLPVKISVIATLIAAAGLVMFVVFPGGNAPLHPQLIWGAGLVLGIAAPISALINNQDQHSQLYFGLVGNAFFLGVLWFVLGGGHG